MKTSDTLAALATALAAAQGEIESAVKDANNPGFKNAKYATLAACWAACRAPLSKHGLAVVQSPGSIQDGRLLVTSMLLHKSGEYLQDEFQMPVATPMTPQATGAAITYARRYSLCSLVGIAAEDDDAQSTSPAVPAPAAPVKKTERQPILTPQQKAILACKEAKIKGNVVWTPGNVNLALGYNDVKKAEDCFNPEGQFRYTTMTIPELAKLSYYCEHGRPIVPLSVVTTNGAAVERDARSCPAMDTSTEEDAVSDQVENQDKDQAAA